VRRSSNDPTTAQRRCGLRQVKKGSAYGVSVHAMMAMDADSGACLGLVGRDVWTRAGVNLRGDKMDVVLPHPGMLPKADPLPHVTCSRVACLGSGDGADQYGSTR
jgi:hypothetical protein